MKKRQCCLVGRVGVLFLLVSFIILPICPSISWGAESAAAGSGVGTESAAGAAGAAGAGAAEGLTTATVLGIVAAAVVAVAVVAASVDDDAETTPQHP